MSNSLTLRLVTVADIPIIVAHRRAMFEEMGHTNRSGLDSMSEQFEIWVTDKLKSNEYRHWFAINEESEIIAGAGVLILELPPTPTDSSIRRANVLNVYTESKYRHRGLAKHLTSTILEWCRDNGIRTVNLHASEAGRSIYESLGFRPTNEMRLQLSAQK